MLEPPRARASRLPRSCCSAGRRPPPASWRTAPRPDAPPTAGRRARRGASSSPRAASARPRRAEHCTARLHASTRSASARACAGDGGSGAPARDDALAMVAPGPALAAPLCWASSCTRSSFFSAASSASWSVLLSAWAWARLEPCCSSCALASSARAVVLVSSSSSASRRATMAATSFCRSTSCLVSFSDAAFSASSCGFISAPASTFAWKARARSLEQKSLGRASSAETGAASTSVHAHSGWSKSIAVPNGAGAPAGSSRICRVIATVAAVYRSSRAAMAASSVAGAPSAERSAAAASRVSSPYCSKQDHSSARMPAPLSDAADASAPRCCSLDRSDCAALRLSLVAASPCVGGLQQHHADTAVKVHRFDASARATCDAHGETQGADAACDGSRSPIAAGLARSHSLTA